MSKPDPDPDPSGAMPTTTTMVEDEAVISFGDDDDEEDEFADLFSFATAPSESMSPSKLSSSSLSSPSKLQSPDHYKDAMASVMPLPPSHHTNDDDDDSESSEDSFLELLDEQKEPLTILEAIATAAPPSKANPDLDSADTNLQEMLDWLDQDDDDQEAARRQQEEEEVVFLPPNWASTEDEKEEKESSSLVPPKDPEPELEFETLAEAVQSPKSSLSQIRKLLQQEQFHVSASVRPHLWCRVVCGKTLEETLRSSVADSFQQWEQHNQALLLVNGKDDGGHPDSSSAPSSTTTVEATSLTEKEAVATTDDANEEKPTKADAQTSQPSAENTQESLSSSSSSASPPAVANGKDVPSSSSTMELTSFQKAQREWILEQSNVLGDRIATLLEGENVIQSQQALASLLLNHYHTGQKPMDEDDDEQQEQEESTTTTTTSYCFPDYQDPLLPPVACAILSAGVPKTAAAVMLSHIVPHFMPILALTRKEREQAAQLMHRQFYLLACYHLPSLALHLDRYLPNWFFWPDCVATKKDGQGGGFVSQSYLVSHLAGECPIPDTVGGISSSGFLLDPRWILTLWDLILTSSNNSLRFYLVLAVLESHADQLVLLTDNALKERLVQVLGFQREDDSTENPTSTDQDASQWVQKWTDKAQTLWERTPVSVSRKLKRVEDQAVTEALTKRQQEAEERMKQKLEAQAKAHEAAVEAERERKADDARLRLTRARLVAFYRQYQPAKENNIDKIMEAYKGRYEVLDSKLKQKYGVGFNPAVKPKTAPARNASSQPTSRTQVRGGKDSANANDDEEAKKKRNQIVVKVGPSEVLPELCWSKQANKVRMYKLDRGNKLEENIETRLPLKFYLVDTRPVETAKDQGRFPTSVSFPPDDLIDPDRLKQQEEMFEGLRGAIHIVIMGEGFAALPALYGHKVTEGLAECIREDDARNNNCALFFLKKGFPFVSTLDGGFAAAHAFLCREGKNHHLRVHDVLSDYNPDVSIFGQFERVHNSTGREKAQRALQNIFESSLVALTKNTRRFETLASEVGDDQQQQNKGGNMVSRFFAVGGLNEEVKRNNPIKNIDQVSEPFAPENDNKGGTAGPVFRNPFARKQSPKLARESSSSSLDVESVDDLDTDSGHEMVDNKAPSRPPLEKKQVSSSITTKPDEQQVQPPAQPKPTEQPKANPFAGFGAAFKAASKAAAGDPGNKGRGINPFARFNQQGRNLGNSQHGGKGLGSSRHGLGGSRHGMGLGGSRHGLGNSQDGKKPESQGPGIGIAKNLVGLNQFRINAFSRVRSSGDSVEGNSVVPQDDIKEEAVSFNQTSSILSPTEPEQINATETGETASHNDANCGPAKNNETGAPDTKAATSSSGEVGAEGAPDAADGEKSGVIEAKNASIERV